MVNYIYIDTPVGVMTIASEDGALIKAGFGKQEVADGVYAPDIVLMATARELGEYFSGSRRRFDIPLAPKGTEFQLKVWNALKLIPYGQTRSYGQIAMMINEPDAARAVGSANNKNPIAIIVPCHRVIGADGDLTGYAGGLDIKQKLLELEKDNK